MLALLALHVLSVRVPQCPPRECRSPQIDDLNTAKCPGAKCTGAHSCSWAAIAHAVPPSGECLSVLEIVRKMPWGFREYGPRRKGVGVQHFLSSPHSHARNASVGIFHILVGEGVSRDDWRLALIGAIRAGIRELWVMERPVFWPELAGCR